MFLVLKWTQKKEDSSLIGASLISRKQSLQPNLWMALVVSHLAGASSITVLWVPNTIPSQS